MPAGVVRRCLILVPAGVVLFVGLAYALFPAARIDEALARLLAPQGLTLAPAVRKTLVPGLLWNDCRLASGQGELLRLDRLTVRPLFLPLFAGRLACGAEGRLGNGRLELKAAANGREALQLDIRGVGLADIPFVGTVLGARATGELRSRGALVRGPEGIGGELQLEIKGLEFSGVKLGAFALPDAANLTTQGMVRVVRGRARLESLTLQGEGIYMRLSGELPTGPAAALAPLSLVLEIMPKPEFLERQKLVFLLLARFMASPGVYRVPIRGTLLKPEII